MTNHTPINVRFRDRVAIVTGASVNIARAIAQQLGLEGARVIYPINVKDTIPNVLLCFTALLLLQAPGLAATYYISPSGNDTTGNGSSGNPWLTLQKASQSVIPGDLVLAQPGTYSYPGQNTLNATGTPANPITYRANGAVTLNFTDAAALGIYITGSNVIFDGFKLRGSDAPMYLATVSNVEVKNCNIASDYATWYEFVILGSSSCKIHHNVFDGSVANRVAIGLLSWTTYHSANTQVDNNTIVGKGNYAIELASSGATGSEFKNNLIKSCANGILDSTTNHPTAHDYNTLHSISGTAFSGTSPQAHETTAFDPKLVNQAGGDYHLQTNSPCIDSGTYAGLAYLGSAPDRGTFESSGASVGVGSVSGTVQRGSDSAVISGATVSASVLGVVFSTTTDTNGNYTLSNLPGTYVSIKAVKAGYVSKSISAKATASGVDFSLGSGYYVAPNGSDTTGDGGETNPWATIDYADRNGLLSAGATVIVAAGTYTVTASNGVYLAQCSGTASAPITYKANGVVNVVSTSPGADPNCIKTDNVHDLVIDGFRFSGRRAAWFHSSWDMEIKNCRFSSNDSPAAGLLFYTTYGISFHNNVVGPFPSATGVKEMDARDPGNKYYNNTVISCGGYGMWFTGRQQGYQPAAGHETEAKNNIIKSCSTGMYFDNIAWSDLVHDYNSLYLCTTAFGGKLTAQTHETTTTNPSLNGDYHLQFGSACIDSGVDVGFIFGGATPDCGAFEHYRMYTAVSYNWSGSSGAGSIDETTGRIRDDLKAVKKTGLEGIWVVTPMADYRNGGDWFTVPTGTWREDQLARLRQKIEYADSLGLKIIIGMAYGAFGPHWFTEDLDFQNYLDYVQRIVTETAKYKNVAYVFSGEEINSGWYAQTASYPECVRSFRNWCYGQNTSISYWNTRWGTSYTWDTIVPSWLSSNSTVDYFRWMYTGIYRPRMTQVANLIKGIAPDAVLGYHEWLVDSRISTSDAPIPLDGSFAFVSSSIYGGLSDAQSRVPILKALFPSIPISICELGTTPAAQPTQTKPYLDGQGCGYNWWSWWQTYTPNPEQWNFLDENGARRSAFSLYPNAAYYGTIKGQITESGTGTALGNVGVIVNGNNVRSIYDRGLYRIDLDPGTYTVDFVTPNHQKTTLSNVTVTAGADNTRNVAMTPVMNRLSNGGFESDLSSWSLTRVGGTASSFISYNDVTHGLWGFMDSIDGDKYLMVCAEPSPSDIYEYQNVTVNPGTTNTLSWYDKTVGTWDANNWFKVIIRQTGHPEQVLRTATSAAGWTYRSVNFTTAASLTTASVVFEVNTAATRSVSTPPANYAAVDWVQLVTTNSPTAFGRTFYSQVISNDLPLAYWNFDEPGGNVIQQMPVTASPTTVNDLVPANNATRAAHGAIGSGLALGNTADLDGTSTFYAAAPDLGTLGTDQWGIEFWMQLKSQASLRQDYMVSFADAGNKAIVYDFVKNQMRWEAGTGGMYALDDQDTNWHHLIWVSYGSLGATGDLDIYLDGVLITTNTVTPGSDFQTFSKITVGDYKVGGGFGYLGRLDELAIYDFSAFADVPSLKSHVEDMVARHRDAAVAPVLSFTIAGNQLTLSWLGNGILQETTGLSSPSWTDVPGGASSPVTVTIGTGSKYFSLRLP
jgi:hypothetical protein